MITLENIAEQKVNFFSKYDKTIKKLIAYAMHNDNASGFRIQLASLLGELYNIPEKEQAYNAFLVEVIHEATLLHDDVIDNAKIRRGKASSANKFGAAISVLTGDLILSAVINDCVEKENYALLNLISNSLTSLCEGEIIQNTTSINELTIEKYEKIAKLKTSTLIISGAISSLVNQDIPKDDLDKIKAFASDYGIAYQMIDDLKDLLPSSITGKDQYNDIDDLSPALPLLVYKNLNGNLKATKKEIIEKIISNENLEECYKIIDNQIEKSLRHLETINTLKDNYKLILLIREPFIKLKSQLKNNL